MGESSEVTAGEQTQLSELSVPVENEAQTEQEKALSYLQSDRFQKAVIDACSKKEADYDIKLAELQGRYAQALLQISGGTELRNFNSYEELHVWDKSVREIMFDENNPDSLASRANREMKFPPNMKEQFTGATSLLTFMSLWQDIYPEEADVAVYPASGKDDARKKFDAVVTTSDKITIVQLKSNTRSQVRVVDVPRVDSYLGGKIDEDDVYKMFTARDRFRDRENARAEKTGETPRPVDVIIVEVPGIESECIQNVFGAVLSNRDDLVLQLRNQAEWQKIGPTVAPVAA